MKLTDFLIALSFMARLNANCRRVSDSSQCETLRLLFLFAPVVLVGVWERTFPFLVPVSEATSLLLVGVLSAAKMRVIEMINRQKNTTKTSPCTCWCVASTIGLLCRRHWPSKIQWRAKHRKSSLSGNLSKRCLCYQHCGSHSTKPFQK